MTEVVVESLELRLARLEQANRRLKWMQGLLAVGSVLALVAVAKLTNIDTQRVTGPVIEAERILIKDPTGKVRVMLGMDETLGSPEEARYGLFIQSADGQSATRLNDWNLHIHTGKRSADFSPISVEMKEYKRDASRLYEEVAKTNRIKSNLTQQEQAELDRLLNDLQPLTQFYLNMSGPYIELMKRPMDGKHSGAGAVQVGVSPYPSVNLRSSIDQTSVSISALEGGAGFTMRDAAGNKRAEWNVGTLEGAAINLYDVDGKTIRATLGNVSLETIKTRGIQQRPASSLVLFDKDGKVMWSTPRN